MEDQLDRRLILLKDLKSCNNPSLPCISLAPFTSDQIASRPSATTPIVFGTNLDIIKSQESKTRSFLQIKIEQTFEIIIHTFSIQQIYAQRLWHQKASEK